MFHTVEEAIDDLKKVKWLLFVMMKTAKTKGILFH